MNAPTLLARHVEAFFTRRLMQERGASPHTLAAYRDCFRLLLGFAHRRIGKAPSALALSNLDAPLIASFLEHLEKGRGNTVRTRKDRKSTRLNSSHIQKSRMPSSA